MLYVYLHKRFTFGGSLVQLH